MNKQEVLVQKVQTDNGALLKDKLLGETNVQNMFLSKLPEKTPTSAPV